MVLEEGNGVKCFLSFIGRQLKWRKGILTNASRWCARATRWQKTMRDGPREDRDDEFVSCDDAQEQRDDKKWRAMVRESIAMVSLPRAMMRESNATVRMGDAMVREREAMVRKGDAMRKFQLRLPEMQGKFCKIERGEYNLSSLYIVLRHLA